MNFPVCNSVFFTLLLLLYPTKCENPSSSFFQNLVSAVRESLQNLPMFLKRVSETLSAAIDEECEFKCPNGRKPKKNPYYTPVGNGCGVPGLQVPSYVPVKQLEDCCNEHDVCYGDCNTKKEKCDGLFRKCLYSICKSGKKYLSEEILKGCKTVAKTLDTAVAVMGCKYYLDAQKEACICSESYQTNEL